MRRVTRNAVLAILAVLVVLLALGALPGLLGSGDPYRMTAEPMDADAVENRSAVANATGLSERQYPYATEALANGTSEPYRRSRWGIKEPFTHSPFDELEALAAQSNQTAADGVVVTDNGTFYRLAVRQRP